MSIHSKPLSMFTTDNNYDTIPNVVKDTFNVSEECKSLVSITIICTPSPSASISSRSCVDIEKELKALVPPLHDETTATSKTTTIGHHTLPCPHLGFDLLVLWQQSSTSIDDTSSTNITSTTTAALLKKRKNRKEEAECNSNIATTFFVFNIKPDSVASNSLLKEGDQIVQWMGEEITSVRQFYYGISRCPTLWLTIKRIESSFEKKQRLTIEQFLQSKQQQQQCGNIHEKLNNNNNSNESIFSIIDNNNANNNATTLNSKTHKELQLQQQLVPTTTSTNCSNIRPTDTASTSTKTSKSKHISTINDTTMEVTIAQPSSSRKKKKDPNEENTTTLASAPKKKKKKSSSTSTIPESNVTSSIHAEILPMSATCPSSVGDAKEKPKKRKKVLETVNDKATTTTATVHKDTKKIKTKEMCSVITPPPLLPPPPPADDSLFTTPLDDKNLPRSWRKTALGHIEHIESGIRVYNSRQMNRVLQLLYYYAPNNINSNSTTGNSISVQEAVKQSRNEYKEYKKRVAAKEDATTKSEATAAAPPAKFETAEVKPITTEVASDSKKMLDNNATMHFNFDLQHQPRGWLRFSEIKKGKPVIYWKHCLTQRKVKDPSIMPRVLQLLEQRCVGKNITVKEAIKQSKEENLNGLYIVNVFDSSSDSMNLVSISAGNNTNCGVSTSTPTNNDSANGTASARYSVDNLPLTWKKVKSSVDANNNNKRRHSYFLHIESGIKVYEARLMPYILELLEKQRHNNNDQEVISVKEAIRLAREELVLCSQPMKV